MKPLYRVAIIGSGAIGATLAYTLFTSCPATEVLLVNRDERKAWAKAFDISHTSASVVGEGMRAVELEECTDCDVIVLTVGSLPKENGTRADVLGANVAIFSQLIPSLVKHNPRAVFINITNPVDAMAYAIQRLGNLPPGRVMGSGTELDSQRLRYFTAETFGLDPKQLVVDVIGEHGDTMVPLWSQAQYNGAPLVAATGLLSAEVKEQLLHRTRRAGWDIRQAGEHSCYAVSYSVSRIVKGLLGVEPGCLLVSSARNPVNGGEGVLLSLPTQLDKLDVGGRPLPEMAEDERQLFARSLEWLTEQQALVDRLL